MAEEQKLGSSTSMPSSSSSTTTITPPPAPPAPAKHAQQDTSTTTTLISSTEAGTGTCTHTEQEKPELQQAHHLLTSLYEIHDFFFTANKAEKRSMLQEASTKILTLLDQFGEGDTNKERATVAYIKGKALDVYQEYNKEAEAALTKAVKLEPSNVEAWNALGHCFWKKRDLQAARDCFTQALTKHSNKASLRHLSMLLRQFPYKTAAEGKELMQESLTHAKAALKLDMGDPTSWYYLGNAYITLFFKHTHTHTDLEKAMQAYQHAEAKGGETNPDLYFNKGEILRYQENFALAAENFRKASDLDPSLPGEEMVGAIERRVRRTVDLLMRKGKVKEKRLAQMVVALKEEEEAYTHRERDTQTQQGKGLEEAERGGKEGKEKGEKTGKKQDKNNQKQGSITHTHTHTHTQHQQPPPPPTPPLALPRVSLSDLSEGSNHNKLLALKLVLPLGQQDHPPNAFIMLDKTGTCTVLSLYHLDLDATQRFGEKDVFHVLHPYVKLVEGLTPATATSSSTSPSSSSSSSTTTTSKKGEQKENGQDHTHTHTHTPQETECWSYRTIQILDPASLLVNGRPVDVRHVTPAKVVLDNFDL